MKTRQTKVETRFEPEARFEINPIVPPAPFRGVMESELELLKGRLLRELLNEQADAAMHVRLRRAANDAASMVWLTPFPLLLFPTLFEEKARMARRQLIRQQRIRLRSQTLLDTASAPPTEACAFP